MGYLSAWVMNGVRIIFVHFILCLSFFSSTMGVMGRYSNETDRLALLEFKAKITSDPFGVMALWNDSTHFCEWYGVTCNTRRQRVIQMDLTSMKLGGSISPHLGNLSFLHVLRLVDNNLVRQIPQEFGRLRRLGVLNLLNNTLGGEIPLNLSSCSKLEILVLSNNKLVGRIPPELGSLSKLRSLGVSKNNLTGTLPPSLGNLTFLEELFVSFNNLLGRVPESLGNLNLLTTLALPENHFFGEIPLSLFNLTYLERLDVGLNNKLGGPLPWDMFHTLPNLGFISFQGNEFTGPIPTSLSNASNLEIVQLAMNGFIGTVPSLQSLNKVSSFLIYENQLGSSRDIALQDDLSFLCSLTNATDLRGLVVDTNRFRGILPSCIANLSTKLEQFTIYNNYITGTIPPSIDNLVGLEVLDFDNNSLTGSIPPTLGNMKSLAILHLLGNNLSGTIPTSLGNLSKLLHLDLSSNRLEGRIPSSLHKCTSLLLLGLDHNNLSSYIPPQLFTMSSLSIQLSLSHNHLTGPLPEGVGKLTNLNVLDVSANLLSGGIPNSFAEGTMQFLNLGGNDFQGPIPSSLSSLKGLQILDLSSNNLSSQIPDVLISLSGLILVNLSFNDLEGAVPMKGVFKNATAVLLKGNSKLCGGIPALHLPNCATILEMKRGRLSTIAKVAIFTAAGIGCVAVFALLLYVLGIRRKQAHHPDELVVPSSENQPLKYVSYGDLHRATNGFSQGNLVGSGSFGHVYRGSLGHVVVAIKVLNLNRHGASKSFLAECEALRNIRHRNLVKLLTVCSGIDYQGNEFKALVYEFMPNRSLEDWLHQPATVEEQCPARKLGLLKRLGIAIDVASLLEYVHHEFGTPLVHCDIKPSNILLDGDLSGHVSDFGLARFLLDSDTIHNAVSTSSSTGVRGTIGYAPPEYGLGGEVSTQGDVYSYGILLLEMFTGKRPTDEMFKEGLTLHVYAKMALSTGVLNILDPVLHHLWETEDQVLNPTKSARIMDLLGSVIEIGVTCSNESPMERMNIGTVTKKLQTIRLSLSRGRN